MLQVALVAFQTVIDDFLDHTNSYAMARALTETRPAAWWETEPIQTSAMC